MEYLSLDTLVVGILYVSLICEIFECVTQKIAQEEGKKISDRPGNRFTLASRRHFNGSMRRTSRHESLRHFAQMRILARR